MNKDKFEDINERKNETIWTKKDEGNKNGPIKKEVKKEIKKQTIQQQKRKKQQIMSD